MDEIDFSDILFTVSLMQQLVLDWKLVWLSWINDAGVEFIIEASWQVNIEY